MGSSGCTCFIWNFQDLELKKYCTIHHPEYGVVSAITYATKKNKLVVGYSDNYSRIWCMKMLKQLNRFRGHSDWITSLDLDVDGENILCSGSNDKTAKIWRLDSGELLTPLDSHQAV